MQDPLDESQPTAVVPHLRLVVAAMAAVQAVQNLRLPTRAHRVPHPLPTHLRIPQVLLMAHHLTLAVPILGAHYRAPVLALRAHYRALAPQAHPLVVNDDIDDVDAGLRRKPRSQPGSRLPQTSMTGNRIRKSSTISYDK